MNMYRNHILDLYKNPLNKGKISDETTAWEEYNTTCGDKIRISIKVEANKVIDIKFDGIGCAISIASASLLTENLKGKNIQEIKNMHGEDMIDILGINVSPARIKCALLGFNTAKKAIEVYDARNK